MGEQFCLRWNNHQNTLISVFDNLLGTETLVDCTLVAEGKLLKGHKVVLSACSPLLEMLLSQHHDKHPIVILKDIKFHELKAMMDYMYRGEVNISQDQIDTFLKAAESLQIKGLTDQGGGSEESTPQPPVKASTRPAEAKSPLRDDGVPSPSAKRRRRQRRASEDMEDTSNSCDNISPSTSNAIAPNVPNFTVAVTPSEPPPPKHPPLDPNPPPIGVDHIKTKTEPPDLIQPKAEYIESLNNEDSVEDLTLDDDDDFSSSQPGPSHLPAPNSLSSQGGFASWQLGGDRSNDEVFMAAQQAINNQANTQGDCQQAIKKKGEFQCDKCTRTYAHSDTLRRHMKLECGKIPSIACSYCSYRTKRNDSLQRHIVSKHLKNLEYFNAQYISDYATQLQ